MQHHPVEVRFAPKVASCYAIEWSKFPAEAPNPSEIFLERRRKSVKVYGTAGIDWFSPSFQKKSQKESWSSGRELRSLRWHNKMQHSVKTEFGIFRIDNQKTEFTLKNSALKTASRLGKGAALPKIWFLALGGADPCYAADLNPFPSYSPSKLVKMSCRTLYYSFNHGLKMGLGALTRRF